MLSFSTWIKNEGLDVSPALGKALGDVIQKSVTTEIEKKRKEEEAKKKREQGVTSPLQTTPQVQPSQTLQNQIQTAVQKLFQQKS